MKTPNILVLGDSLSAAHGMPAARGWVELLRERVAERAPAYRVQNASRSGLTADAAMDDLERSLRKTAPAIVVLQLGANDALGGTPIEQLRRSLERLVTTAQKHTDHVVLLGLRIAEEHSREYAKAFFWTYYEVAKTTRALLVPMLLRSVDVRPDLLQADGIHPTADAQPMLLENAWPKIERALARYEQPTDPADAGSTAPRADTSRRRLPVPRGIFRLGRLRGSPDPYAHYANVREQRPVQRSAAAGGWVFTRYRDVLSALQDRRLSVDERGTPLHDQKQHSLRQQGIVPDEYDDAPSLLGLDPPDHTRIRRLVHGYFTPRGLRALEGRIVTLVHELLDPLRSQREFDLMQAVAAPLPVAVIAEILGVPPEERARFRALSDARAQYVGSRAPRELTEVVSAGRSLRTYLADLVERRLARPQGDLISILAQASVQGGVDEKELLSTLVTLLVAGHETTVHLIGNGVNALLSHPDQLQLLRDDPKRIRSAVEEMLRWDTPVQYTRRIAREDLCIAGAEIRTGEQILLCIGAANRDPHQFPDADRFDIERSPARHLSFGQGIHYCLGAELARMQARHAILALLERHPSLRRGPGDLRWIDSTILHGLERLPIVASTP